MTSLHETCRQLDEAAYAIVLHVPNVRAGLVIWILEELDGQLTNECFRDTLERVAGAIENRLQTGGW